jgi:hypothetical protein
VRGGSWWEQFRRRKVGGWTGSGRGAREEGGEAVGCGDLGGGGVGEENSGEEKQRRLGVARRKKRQSSRGEGVRSGFVAAHGL